MAALGRSTGLGSCFPGSLKDLESSCVQSPDSLAWEKSLFSWLLRVAALLSLGDGDFPIPLTEIGQPVWLADIGHVGFLFF